jgi:hypothetical protein
MSIAPSELDQRTSGIQVSVRIQAREHRSSPFSRCQTREDHHGKRASSWISNLGFVSARNFANSYGTNHPLAGKPSRPMMSTNGGGDRNTLRIPILSDGLRSWSFGLFDCFADLPTCMYGLGFFAHLHLQFFLAHRQR